jgi:hypothetical protein
MTVIHARMILVRRDHVLIRTMAPAVVFLIVHLLVVATVMDAAVRAAELADRRIVVKGKAETLESRMQQKRSI